MKEIQENTKANKEEMQKSLKEIQENFDQQAEVMKEETQKSLKELEENTNKQMTELSKNFQDLKTEVETTKKAQIETTLEIEKLGKRSGNIDANINNRIQEIKES